MDDKIIDKNWQSLEKEAKRQFNLCSASFNRLDSNATELAVNSRGQIYLHIRAMSVFEHSIESGEQFMSARASIEGTNLTFEIPVEMKFDSRHFFQITRENLTIDLDGIDNSGEDFEADHRRQSLILIKNKRFNYQNKIVLFSYILPLWALRLVQGEAYSGNSNGAEFSLRANTA